MADDKTPEIKITKSIARDRQRVRLTRASRRALEADALEAAQEAAREVAPQMQTQSAFATPSSNMAWPSGEPQNGIAACAAPAPAPAPAPSSRVSELVLLGTGVSTALPRISCAIRGVPRIVNGNLEFVRCKVCDAGLADPLSPNRRCNVSALVRLDDHAVLIDCGKTIRETTLRFFPQLGVRTVDAVVLTHGHADAMMGLDDLRDIQDLSPMPVHVSEATMKDCQRCFPYLVQKPERDIVRRVASIDWTVFPGYFTPFRPVPAANIEFTPVPLIHGGDYISAGYIITGNFVNSSTIIYFSDVSRVPEETIQFLKSLKSIDVLIIDSLQREPHSSHFSLEQAIMLAREVQPAVTRCVGMTCALGLHETVDAELEKLLDDEGLDIRLGFDGQRLLL